MGTLNNATTDQDDSIGQEDHSSSKEVTGEPSKTNIKIKINEWRKIVKDHTKGYMEVCPGDCVPWMLDEMRSPNPAYRVLQARTKEYLHTLYRTPSGIVIVEYLEPANPVGSRGWMCHLPPSLIEEHQAHVAVQKAALEARRQADIEDGNVR